MHDTSFATMRSFVDVHLEAARGHALDILDFGSQMVAGQGLSYASLFDDPEWRYRGLDIEPGLNVDVVVDDAYDWHDVPDDSVDLVVSGQALEHVEYFWASVFEIVRVLKPGGLATIIAPSGGFEHRFPVDCWRFYPDGFRALAVYAGCELVDVFTDWQHGEWDDSILVMRKPQWDAGGRARFAQRAALQRALLADGDPRPEVRGSPQPGEVSILGTARAGALTAALVAERDRRREREAHEAAAADAARQAELDRLIRAEAERLAAERLDSITPVRIYGRVRNGAARLVGERGRALYRRLRGRSAP